MRELNRDKQYGFTLIELSIVLVITGLIIGGVLVGRDLISAAGVRAQISQIEKYQSAVNTFRGKYGYLPGDIPDPTATQFGFAARGTAGWRGMGDGNGVLELNDGTADTADGSYRTASGEMLFFWEDLSVAGLIEGGFTYNNSGYWDSGTVYASNAQLAMALPPAKIGQGNYIFVSSGGWHVMYVGNPDNLNYFNISVVTAVASGILNGQAAGLTVNQAFAIDSKMDDGLPQEGRVIAFVANPANYGWAIGGSSFGNASWNQYGPNGAPMTAADGIPTQPTPVTCYDNDNVPNIEHYSIGQNNGAGMNCLLSFVFE